MKIVTKDRVIITAYVAGFVLAVLLFWKLVSLLMWACYSIGIKM